MQDKQRIETLYDAAATEYKRLCQGGYPHELTLTTQQSKRLWKQRIQWCDTELAKLGESNA